jgi:mono/diheme cytochrome c family protein
MNTFRLALIAPLFLVACATETATEAPYDPFQDYEELNATTVLPAPSPVAGNFAPEHRFQVEHGRYLVELLACGSCHTDGALQGAPKMNKSLAGSSIGIAYANPLGIERPGIVYPPNITPDKDTGIGLWSDQDIERAIRTGLGRHTGRPIAVMPWRGYTKMTDEDVNAIVSYLRSIKPVEHQVPDEVAPGQKASSPFIYYGVYRSR